MKLVVAGASSFTGKAFIRYAKARGHEVATLGRPEHDMNGALPRVAQDLVALGFSRVVNFAALNMVGESWANAADYYRTNVIGMAAFGQALLEAKVERFVNVSTPEVYGTTGAFLREGAAFNPSTPYAVSRAAGDWHLRILHRQYGLNVCFTRTVNVYGPEQQSYRIVPKAALCALLGRRLALHGGGVSTRSFIHVDDVAAGILAVLERGRVGEDYHMATGRQTSIRELVSAVFELAGAKLSDFVDDVPDRPGKDMAYQLDDSKIRNELGWSDRVDLYEGLAATVAWVRENLNELKRLPTEYTHRA